MQLRSIIAILCIGSACAFSPAGAAPLRRSATGRSVSTPMMRGWQDQFSGNAFKEGKRETLKVQENDVRAGALPLYL